VSYKKLRDLHAENPNSWYKATKKRQIIPKKQQRDEGNEKATATTTGVHPAVYHGATVVGYERVGRLRVEAEL
jgi:hypothetical protein